MIFGGLERFSVIDYPGKTCAIVFTVGCNFRCPYCHNPELVTKNKDTVIVEETEILEFLENRIGKLDALSITGGEPTLHEDLLSFMEKVKEMGFSIKLDSNGTRPNVLEEALKHNLVDYLAMDVKAPLDKYDDVTILHTNISDIEKSIELIKNSNVDHEFRTTIVKNLLTKDDILKIGETVKGAKRYYLQKFISTKTNDLDYIDAETYTDEELEELRDKISKNVEVCGVR